MSDFAARGNLSSQGFLLDTNIWLDYCLPNRLRHERAFELVDACVRKDVPLFVSVGSLKDLFYILEKSYRTALAKSERPPASPRVVSQEMSWGLLSTISELAQVVGVDESDVWMARKLKGLHGDFEDDLIISACQRGNVAHLVSNDVALKQNAPLSVLTLEQALVVMELEGN